MTVVLPFPPARPRVFIADAFNPPPPPIGALAVELRDASGSVLAYAWTSPVIPRSIALATAYEWSDALRSLVTPAAVRPSASGA